MIMIMNKDSFDIDILYIIVISLVTYLILIIASASADGSGDESAAKYSEMSAILGFLGHVQPTYPSLCPPPKKTII